MNAGSILARSCSQHKTPVLTPFFFWSAVIRCSTALARPAPTPPALQAAPSLQVCAWPLRPSRLVPTAALPPAEVQEVLAEVQKLHTSLYPPPMQAPTAGGGGQSGNLTLIALPGSSGIALSSIASRGETAWRGGRVCSSCRGCSPLDLNWGYEGRTSQGRAHATGAGTRLQPEHLLVEGAHRQGPFSQGHGNWLLQTEVREQLAGAQKPPGERSSLTAHHQQ